MEDDKRIYCYQVMKGLSINPNGVIRPCCAIQVPATNGPGSKYFITDGDGVDEFLNLDLMTSIRKDLKNGIQSEYCFSCWNVENAGMQSIRQSHNIDKEALIPENKWDDVSDDGFIDSSAITYLDLSLGNSCNLKCRSCNSYSSNQWIEETEHYLIDYIPEYSKDLVRQSKLISTDPWYRDKFNSKFFDTILPNVRHINFIGGEPLTVKEHYTFLSRIIDNGWAGNISLSYNTNGTLLPPELLEIWKKFKHIELGISIDAIGELAYYVRHPSNWEKINNNVHNLIQYAKEQKHVGIQVHTTLSLLNILNLHEVIDWTVKLYNIGNFYDNERRLSYGIENALPHFNIVDKPSYLHMRNLPDEIKLMVIQQLENIWIKYKDSNMIPAWNVSKLEEIKKLESIITQPINEKDWKLFVDITRESDSYRGVDIINYLPWMKKFL